MTQNQLKYWELEETKRHNAAVEGENLRHNVANEELTRRSTDVTEAHYVRQDVESQRHNIQDELLTHQSTVQRAASGVRDLYSLGSTMLLGDQFGLQAPNEETANNMISTVRWVGDVVEPVMNETVQSAEKATKGVLSTAGNFLAQGGRGLLDATTAILDAGGRAIMTPFFALYDSMSSDNINEYSTGAFPEVEYKSTKQMWNAPTFSIFGKNVWD